MLTLKLKVPLRRVAFLAVLLGFFLSTAPKVSAAVHDPVTGYWRTQDGDGVVELYSCDQQICGRLHWFEVDNPDHVSRDTKNPDPDKRDAPLCRLQFMGGFVPDGEGHYEDGWIYNPRSGSTYNARMTLTDKDTLDLHGYIFFPFLGESQIWTRAGALPKCTMPKP